MRSPRMVWTVIDTGQRRALSGISDRFIAAVSTLIQHFPLFRRGPCLPVFPLQLFKQTHFQNSLYIFTALVYDPPDRFLRIPIFHSQLFGVRAVVFLGNDLSDAFAIEKTHGKGDLLPFE